MSLYVTSKQIKGDGLFIWFKGISNLNDYLMPNPVYAYTHIYTYMYSHTHTHTYTGSLT